MVNDTDTGGSERWRVVFEKYQPKPSHGPDWGTHTVEVEAGSRLEAIKAAREQDPHSVNCSVEVAAPVEDFSTGR